MRIQHITKSGKQMKYTYLIYLIPFLIIDILCIVYSVITTQHESVEFKLENGWTATITAPSDETPNSKRAVEWKVYMRYLD